jgi:hypothetical protein
MKDEMSGAYSKSIKINFEGIVCEGVNLIQLVQDKVHWWVNINNVMITGVQWNHGIS